MTKKHIILGSTVGIGLITIGGAIIKTVVDHKRTTKLFERLDDISESIDDVAVEAVDQTKLINDIEELLEEIRNHTDDIASCAVEMNGMNKIKNISISKEEAGPTLTSDINDVGPGGPM